MFIEEKRTMYRVENKNSVILIKMFIRFIILSFVLSVIEVISTFLIQYMKPNKYFVI